MRCTAVQFLDTLIQHDCASQKFPDISQVHFIALEYNGLGLQRAACFSSGGYPRRRVLHAVVIADPQTDTV